MTDLRTAAQQALEALDTPIHEQPFGLKQKAITTLRAALAQPGQDVPEADCGNMEPVAWMYEGIKHDGAKHGPHLVWKPQYMDAMSADKGAKAVPLYTAPPKRKPQDHQCPHCGKVTKPGDIHTCSPRVLTDEVIADLWAKNGTYHHHFARAIERWLRGEG